jgi:outer membrane biosynthesis protein TonB
MGGAPPMGGPFPPPGRQGELLQPQGQRTVYEFTGGAARQHTDGRTFVGATLDISNLRERRESNLTSGISTWLFMLAAVLAIGGLVAYSVYGPGASAHDGDEADASQAVAGAEETKTEPAAEAKAEEAKAEEAKAEEPTPAEPAPAEPVPAAEEPKPAEPAPAPAAEEPKPADPPAPAPAAEEPKPADPPAPAPAAEEPKPTPSTPAPKKKKKKPAATPTQPAPSGGGKTLSPKKPPRDPLKGLPKPP